MNLISWIKRRESQPNAPFVASLQLDASDLPDAPRLDLNSPTWRFIRDHLNAHLAELREMNDSPKNDDAKTALIRGRIREVKDLLGFGNPGAYSHAEVGDE